MVYIKSRHMNMTAFNTHILRLAAILLTAGLFVSCSKDKPAPPGGGGYPKEVTIEYKVTVLTGGLTVGNIDYVNETGGITMDRDKPLPYSKSFKRTVNQYEYATFTFASGKPGSVKAEILVNGQPMETQTFAGSSGSFAGSVKYIFP